jgi:hypothetical protein
MQQYNGDHDDSAQPLVGHYANCFQVGYNAFEFLLDFGQSYETDQTIMHTRIILLPSYAKNLAELLYTSLASHEHGMDGYSNSQH